MAAPAPAEPGRAVGGAGGAGSGGRVRRLLRRSPFVVLIVVVAVALAVGSQRHGRPTLEQRTLSIASAVRCPVCVGETAAESNVSFSVEIRVAIRQDLQAGQSRSQILSQLVAAYGPSILERPPAKGIDLLLWVVPVLVAAAAVAGLTLLFLRWRPAAVDRVSDDDRLLVGQLLDDPAPDLALPPALDLALPPALDHVPDRAPDRAPDLALPPALDLAPDLDAAEPSTGADR